MSLGNYAHASQLLKPMCPRARAPQEKPPQREAQALQLGKARMKQ